MKNHSNEIIQCRYCGGNGRISISPLFTDPCPVCEGLGKIKLNDKLENFFECSFCNGKGFTSLRLEDNIVCHVCEGIGLLHIKKSQKPKVIKKKDQNSIENDQMRYDIAVSFAGEDRDIVEEYAKNLKMKGINIFYDYFEKANLWGKDLYSKLSDLYKNKAKYCVIFISKNYARKLWTNHERKAAQARAFRESYEYILPVRLDNTEIEGIYETVGYIDLRKTTVDELVNLTIEKLNKLEIN